MMASAAPALFAWIFGRMLFSRLLWWIFESKQEGEFLRFDELLATFEVPVLGSIVTVFRKLRVNFQETF